MGLCRFKLIAGTAADFSCESCGMVVENATLPIRAVCRANVASKPVEPEVLCQLSTIPGTADCRCQNCGQVFYNTHPASLRVRCAKEGLGQPPNVRRAINFGKALGKHWLDVTGKLLTGRLNDAYRSAEEIDRIYETKCKPCPLFNGSICTHANCGCNVGTHEKFLNKLAWASEHCPKEPPEW